MNIEELDEDVRKLFESEAIDALAETVQRERKELQEQRRRMESQEISIAAQDIAFDKECTKNKQLKDILETRLCMCTDHLSDMITRMTAIVEECKNALEIDRK